MSIIQNDALAFAKLHHKEIIRQLFPSDYYVASDRPFSLFMAGSPGSGKTEFSKNLQRELEAQPPFQKIVRLDTDELREELPQYTGQNSDEVHRATTLLFDKAFDYIQSHFLSAIIDTTFASPKSLENVTRALGRGRKVEIFYLHQDPVIAWNYTQKREKIEGRVVPKQVFIDAYFNAKANADRVKQLFGDRIELHVSEKDMEHNFVKSSHKNVGSVAEFIIEKYSKEQLDLLL